MSGFGEIPAFHFNFIGGIVKFALLSLIAIFASTAEAADLHGTHLFDKDVLHEVHLTLSATDWQNLKDHVFENTWFKADFQWKNERVNSVGIRSRGGQWSRDARKPALKIEFGRNVPDQRFHGLDSLAFDNNSQDKSFLSEYLANQVFARHGIPSPRVVHARLIVNGEYAGLYSMIEPLDKKFLKSRFAHDDGDLYEYQWKDHWHFERLDSYTPELFEPRTNRRTHDVPAFNRLMGAIQSGGIGEVSAQLDIKSTVRYLAIENAIGEVDGVIGDSGANNFYLYRNSAGFLFLPWDKDHSFENAEHSIWRGRREFLLTRVLFDDDAWRDRYLVELKKVVDESVNAEWLLPEIERAAARIRPSALSDPLAGNFDEKVSAMKKFARERKAAVRSQIRNR